MNTILLMWVLMVAPSPTDFDIRVNGEVDQEFASSADCNKTASEINQAMRAHAWCEMMVIRS